MDAHVAVVSIVVVVVVVAVVVCPHCCRCNLSMPADFLYTCNSARHVYNDGSIFVLLWFVLFYSQNYNVKYFALFFGTVLHCKIYFLCSKLTYMQVILPLNNFPQCILFALLCWRQHNLAAGICTIKIFTKMKFKILYFFFLSCICFKIFCKYT